MPRFDLNLLGALHALLTEANVTQAARRLGVSQPTMSGMLQRLRYQLGDELLVRKGRGMDLTYFGQSLLESVREALDDIEMLVQPEQAFEPASSTRAFSVMASDYAEAVLLPQVVARLAALAPGMRLVVHLLDKPVERMLAGELDLCVFASDQYQLEKSETREAFDSCHLFDDEFVGVAAAGHPIGDPPGLDEYLRYPRVGVRFPGRQPSLDEAALRKASPQHEFNYCVTGFAMIPVMVASSRMVGLMQRRLAERMSATLPLRIFPAPIDVPRLHETMVWHKRHTDEPSHHFLRSLFIDESRKLQPQPQPQPQRQDAG